MRTECDMFELTRERWTWKSFTFLHFLPLADILNIAASSGSERAGILMDGHSSTVVVVVVVLKNTWFDDMDKKKKMK